VLLPCCYTTRLLTRSFRAAPLPLACCLAIVQSRFSTAALGSVRSLSSAPAAYRVLTSLRGGGSDSSNMSTSASGELSSESTKRGAFILFEGVDRCGKTTQCKLLLERLRAEGHDAVQMRFPGTIRTAHICGPYCVLRAVAYYCYYCPSNYLLQLELDHSSPLPHNRAHYILTCFQLLPLQTGRR
jgi:Thymidylate kinase